MKVEAVIFDLDGTLVDTVRIFHKVVQTIFDRAGLGEISKEEVIHLLRMGRPPLEYLVLKYMSRDKKGRTKDELLEECKRLDGEVWFDIYDKELELFPGASKMLGELKDRGKLLGLATSSWGISEYLEKLGLDSFMDAVITKDDVARMKPAPDPILECLRKLRVRPEASVYVGDAPVDIQAAKAAGTKSIAVLSGAGDRASLAEEKPDAIIEDVGSLIEAMESMGIL